MGRAREAARQRPGEGSCHTPFCLSNIKIVHWLPNSMPKGVVYLYVKPLEALLSKRTFEAIGEIDQH